MNTKGKGFSITNLYYVDDIDFILLDRSDLEKALKSIDKAKLEACHHRCLQHILQIMMLQVKEQCICNSTIRQKLHVNSSCLIMKSWCARWLQKLAYMSDLRNPYHTLISLIPKSRPVGQACKTIRNVYVDAFENILKLNKYRIKSIDTVSAGFPKMAKSY